MIRLPPFRIRPWGLLGAAGFCAAILSLAGFLGAFAWWLEIASHFRVQYALGFLLLAAVFALGRRKRQALLALALAALNALPVARFLLPPAAPSVPSAPPYRAMLLNVNTVYGDPARVRALLAAARPDLLVLEEINPRWLQALAPILDTYPYRHAEPRHDNFGIGLFSRFPLARVRTEPFGIVNVPSLFADVDLDGHPLAVIATHPLPPGSALMARERNAQLDWIARRAAQTPGPRLLLGDLNVSPWSPVYRRFLAASGLHDSARGRSIRPTWPARLPLLWIPLDHILHSPSIAIHSRTVGPNTGSDHLPVAIDFSLPPASPLPLQPSGPKPG